MKKTDHEKKIVKKIVQMPLSELKPHPKQGVYFRDLDEHELQALATDMADNGQTTPVEICSDGRIIAGHQRLRAAKLLGWPTIRCWIRTDLEAQGRDAVEDRLVQDNASRRQLSKLERARAFQRLKKGYTAVRGEGDLRDQLGKLLKVKGKTLERWEKLLYTPVAVQNAFDDGKITATLAYKIAELAEPEQYQIADRILAGEDPKVVALEFVEPVPKRPRLSETAVRRFINRLADSMDDLDGWGLEDLGRFVYGKHLPLLQRVGELVGTLERYSEIHAKTHPKKQRRTIQEAIENITRIRNQNGRTN